MTASLWALNIFPRMLHIPTTSSYSLKKASDYHLSRKYSNVTYKALSFCYRRQYQEDDGGNIRIQRNLTSLM